MRAIHTFLIAGLLLTAVVPLATAHETYESSDGKYQMVLGEQNEPVYTYDFTNLDVIVTEIETDGPVPNVNATVDATLLAPNGEELSMELAPQHGSQNRYEFVEDYILTQPGQYQVLLEGNINGTDVTGEYLLPGPRASFTDIAFPHDDVQDVRELQQENQELRDRIDELETRMTQMEDHMDAMMEGGMDGSDGSDGGDTQEKSANAPGFSLFAALAALAVIAVVRRRRED